MTLRSTLAAFALPIALAACGSPAVPAPKEVAGTWGADCSMPFVKFDGSKVTVFPDKATYDIKSATVAGNEVSVGYKSAAGDITDVYVIDGATLRLDRTKSGAAEATWHKAPMNKCP